MPSALRACRRGERVQRSESAKLSACRAASAGTSECVSFAYAACATSIRTEGYCAACMCRKDYYAVSDRRGMVRVVHVCRCGLIPMMSLRASLSRAAEFDAVLPMRGARLTTSAALLCPCSPAALFALLCQCMSLCGLLIALLCPCMLCLLRARTRVHASSAR